MKKKHVFLLPCLFLLASCLSGEGRQTETPAGEASLAIPAISKVASALAEQNQLSPSGTTVETRIAVPSGFQRTEAKPGSIAAYLRQLPVKPAGAPVMLYDGSEKPFQGSQVAVVDIEIGKRDLQQCADAIMRLRAEYLFQQKKYDDIHFNFTSGDRADYPKYAQGYRASINGSKVSWQKKVAADNSYKTFRKYLDLVFTYAGTASLEKELQAVKNLKDIQAGDVLIQGGHPGHGVMVMDVAVNPETGKKIYLLAQSYMPAQDIHVLKNPSGKNLSPWYSAEVTGEIKTPEWTFYPANLKRFPTW